LVFLFTVIGYFTCFNTFITQFLHLLEAISSLSGAKQFLEDAREGRLEFDAAALMVTHHQKFLEFLTVKWTEGAGARAHTWSVKEGMEQQISLVGSEATFDMVSHRLAQLDITSEPFFNKEQLMLFKWRVEFLNKFFPIEAAIDQYHTLTHY
jgi:hypothetical protein